MEFVIAKKDFDSAVKQILFGRPATSHEWVDLAVGRSKMKLEAKDTNVEVPVEVEAPGNVRLMVSEIAGLKRISKTYEAGPIRISIDGTCVRFQTTSIYLSRNEKQITPRTVDLFGTDQDMGSEVDNDEESTTGGKQMSDSQMLAELERLRAENAQLKNKGKGGISLKVSEKGALSLYGMGRFPVTLYKEQWLRVFDSAEEIKAFIQENDSRLKTKE